MGLPDLLHLKRHLEFQDDAERAGMQTKQDGHTLGPVEAVGVA